MLFDTNIGITVENKGLKWRSQIHSLKEWPEHSWKRSNSLWEMEKNEMFRYQNTFVTNMKELQRVE